MTKANKPSFGLFDGYRVVMMGLSVAAPFAGQLYAEHGADVIWIENPKAVDMCRTSRKSGAWQQDRRNMRSLSINYLSDEGREIFLQLLETTDVLIEASTGGRMEKNGFSDEVLWQRNPGLVIAHISGFGQTGVPEYVKRASYDPIAQAFGCSMRMNGLKGQPSSPAMPFPADYAAAFYAFGMANAALLKRAKTGKGESIDIAQFEAMIRIQANYPTDYLRFGLDYTKEGNHSLIAAVYGTYECGDGVEIYVLLLGSGVVKRMVNLLGLSDRTDLFPEGLGLVPVNTKAAEVIEEAFAQFISQRSAKEVDETLNSLSIPCSTLLDYETAKTNPQYLARNVFIEWNAADNKTSIPGVKVVPELTNHPGQVWRGAPNVGQDNDDILAELGVSAELQQRLYAENKLSKMEYFENSGQ